MDRESWWAAVYGFAKSQTKLSYWTELTELRKGLITKGLLTKMIRALYPNCIAKQLCDWERWQSTYSSLKCIFSNNYQIGGTMWVDYAEKMKSWAKSPSHNMSESSFYQWRLSSISIHATLTTQLPFKHLSEAFILSLLVAQHTIQTIHLYILTIFVCSMEFDKFFDYLNCKFLLLSYKNV